MRPLLLQTFLAARWRRLALYGHPADVRSDEARVAEVGPEPLAPAGNSGYDPDFDFSQPRALPEPARAESNVIVFPKPYLSPPVRVYELAEPMIERPRILDVPEALTPTIQGPLFADIRLEGSENVPDTPAPSPEFELPLQVAQLPVRVLAGLVDVLLVAVASAIFGAVIFRMIPNLPYTKALLGAAIVIPAFFWCVYQYLFLVYAGATAGMLMMGVRLSTFAGRHPSWSERRSRALSLALSCISVGLGFAWAAVDQDMLCWHDRISSNLRNAEQINPSEK